ncbi:MAG: hypothetical protein IT515_18705 [Burkholderiales bacterium]|nr:hypothetical protein [Burkholderiales bacterium]
MSITRANAAKAGQRRVAPRDLGRKVTRNISVQLGLINEVDRIAAVTKTKTGLQMDRSKLLGVLSELLLDAEEHLTLDHIYTPQNFKAAIANAIGVHARATNGASGRRKTVARR